MFSRYRRWKRKLTFSAWLPLNSWHLWLLISLVSNKVAGVERFGLFMIFMLLTTLLGVIVDLLWYQQRGWSWWNHPGMSYNDRD